MAEGVDPAFRIRQKAIRRGEHHSGGSEDDGQRARAGDPAAHRCGGLVACPRGHPNTLDRADGIAALDEIGHP